MTTADGVQLANLDLVLDGTVEERAIAPVGLPPKLELFIGV
jgi:hypothetical protein